MAMSLVTPRPTTQAAPRRQLEGLIAGEADETVGHGGEYREGREEREGAVSGEAR